MEKNLKQKQSMKKKIKITVNKTKEFILLENKDRLLPTSNKQDL